MDISVIIPTFNRTILLKRALNSVISQTFPPAEIIVVDDGSTDRSSEQMIRRIFPQVKYIWQPNKGVSNARNRGLKEAGGEWLAFLDSDDEWLPKKLNCQRLALQHRPQFRMCHSDEIWIRHGQRVNPMKKHVKQGGAIFYHCLPRCVISPSAVLIHRTIFDRVGNFNDSLPACEDYDLWLRICAIYHVLYVPEPLLIKYGGHDDQLSRKYWGMDRFRIMALENIVNSRNLSLAYRVAALRMLLEKLDIVLKGAKKRNRVNLIDSYSDKQIFYGEMLEKATRTISKVSVNGVTP